MENLTNTAGRKNSGILAALSLSTLLFSSYVGPGFAAGTQTVAYFLTKGWVGVVWGPLLVGILTFFWCWLTFEFNRVYRPKDYREQSDMIYKNPIVRQCLGVFKDVFSIIQVLLVVSGMISGAAIIMESTFGLPNIIGTIIFAIVMIGFTLKGSKLVVQLGSILTILIIGIVIFIVAIGIGPCWNGMQEFLAAKTTPEDYGFSTGYAWVVMLSVIALYTCGANAAVPACSFTIKTKRDSIVAAAGSALLCAGATIACTLIFSAGMPAIGKESIPMLYALQKMIGAGSWAQGVYVVIAIAAMLSTGVGLLSGVSERFQLLIGKKMEKAGTPESRRAVIGIVLTIISLLLSRFGILAIIGKGYTLFTLISAPVLIYLLFFTIPYRISKDKKDGTYPDQTSAT